ncbi:hypothetical protein PV721_16790 [Streptomyces sp. MB09-01]|uniref:hypothetical protein n=1 Tax=Streptomyces sp. MB09-01 TaxID=3028666 RepID=UPI0029AA0700|nr:hypothetical protein [Streptomyces sp. MB09-01]MDX3535997.1 hypothetical protein [Streptomyces sp. MB09-01]
MSEQNTTAPGTAPEPAPEVAAAPEAPAASAPGASPAAAPAPASAAAPAPDVWAAPPAPPRPRDRRKLFAALRWTAAVAVFAVVGTGVAYGIAQPERTDIPGLSTQGDGRWTFPVLSKPALPAGAPLAQGPDNKDQTHYAALTGLLLPAPEGSKPEAALKPDKDGVVSPDAFLEEYAPDARAKLKESLEWDGLRQIVGRGWTMPDGTSTRVYLLRFHASDFADLFKGCDANARLNNVSALELDEAWNKAKNTQSSSGLALDFPGAAVFDNSDISIYQEAKPVLGDEQTKVGCLQGGDILAVVLQTRKGEVAAVPFHQTVILQSQLLS